MYDFVNAVRIGWSDVYVTKSDGHCTEFHDVCWFRSFNLCAKLGVHYVCSCARISSSTNVLSWNATICFTRWLTRVWKTMFGKKNGNKRTLLSLRHKFFFARQISQACGNEKTTFCSFQGKRMLHARMQLTVLELELSRRLIRLSWRIQRKESLALHNVKHCTLIFSCPRLSKDAIKLYHHVWVSR